MQCAHVLLDDNGNNHALLKSNENYKFPNAFFKCVNEIN